MTETLIGMIAYKNPHITEDAVRAIMQQTYQDYTLVVWENFSIPLYRDDLKRRLDNYENVIFVPADDNILWSPAVNEVFRWFYKDHKYFMFMNNDIMLPPYALDHLTKAAAKPEVGIVAPWGSSLGGKQDFVHHIDVDYKGKDLYEVLKDRPIKRAATLVGAVMMMRSEVFIEVNGLDETMPLGADDHWLCMCVKDRGYGVYVDESVYVNHVGHATGASTQWNEWGGRSWESFNNKAAGYYATEEEAIKCQWGYEYHPGFEIGTGWDEEKRRTELRGSLDQGKLGEMDV